MSVKEASSHPFRQGCARMFYVDKGGTRSARQRVVSLFLMEIGVQEHVKEKQAVKSLRRV